MKRCQYNKYKIFEKLLGIKLDKISNAENSQLTFLLLKEDIVDLFFNSENYLKSIKVY